MTGNRRIDIKRATNREILAFSLLPLGFFFIDCTVYTVINFYMTDVLKLSMGLVSIVLLGTKVWDAVNDPIMGQIVERTRTKWGKCRPYLLWIPIPLAITTALLFLPVNFPESWNIITKDGTNLGNAGNFIFMLIIYMLYITAYTAIEIPRNSLNPLVFPQKDLRVKAVSISSTIGSLGTVLPSVLIWTMAGLLGNGKKDMSDMGYFWSALIFAVFGAAIMMGSFFGMKEKVYIPPKKVKSSTNLKRMIKDKRIVILLIASFFSGVINIGAMFLSYFARWNCIGILPMDQINSFIEGIIGKNPQIDAVAILPTLLSVMSGISYMLSMLLVPIFLKKMNKKTLWIWTSFIGAAANVIVYIIGIYVVPYNTIPGFILYAVLRFFTNFPLGMSTVLIAAIIADVTDSIEMETGDRIEATVYSFKGLLFKMSAAIFNVVVLNVIDKLGYNAEKMEELTNGARIPLISSTVEASIIDGVNYTSLLNGIFFMLTAVGAIALIAQAIPMLFFKFDENAIEDQLAEYRKQKEAALESELAVAAE
jgi:GPH family glycoside/pentoside/hexuronide:cation symporter